jgi:hypothetical protein
MSTNEEVEPPIGRAAYERAMAEAVAEYQAWLAREQQVERRRPRLTVGQARASKLKPNAESG